MSEPNVRAVSLSKWYGPVTAVEDVTLELTPGVTGLLGPNGSGKTSFMRLVAGLARPSLGRLSVCGAEPFANPKVLSRIGLCPEADALYDDMSALDFVSTMAVLSGVPRSRARERAAEALTDFGLQGAMERKMGGYSRGMRQRAKLAQAVVHQPDVLLLDEPLTGTDPGSRQLILDRVRARADAGALVLFSSHVLPEVEALTDRLVLFARGQLVAQGRASEIREMLYEHPHHIRVECSDPRRLGSAVLAADSTITALTFPSNDEVEFLTRTPEATYAAIARCVLEGKHELRALTSPDATLEALFHYLVERSGRMAGTGADAATGTGVRS